MFPARITLIIIITLTLLFQGERLCAEEIEGVVLQDQFTAGDTLLVLNGAGVRSKFFLDLYVGGLYLQEKNPDPDNIIHADSPMAIHLHIISSMITSKKMEKATREGFAKATGNNTGPIHQQIEQFISVFREQIQENDTYDLVYTPPQGVQVFKNGTLFTTIAGMPFKQALFGIWLGDKPAQQSLKEAMLGL